MKVVIQNIVAVSALMFALASSQAIANGNPDEIPLYNPDPYSSKPVNSNLPGRHKVIQFKGWAYGVETHYDTTGDGATDTTGMCFRAPIYNPANGEMIGDGMDCLDVKAMLTSAGGTAVKLNGTGFFKLGRATLVVNGKTTVQPTLRRTKRDGIKFTHITGANGRNGVAWGTYRFRNAKGGVRLSGQVDMSKLESEGKIYFDCLFVVEFR